MEVNVALDYIMFRNTGYMKWAHVVIEITLWAHVLIQNTMWAHLIQFNSVYLCNSN